MNEELQKVIESTANTLRGMTMDPSIPDHARNVLADLVTDLESLIPDDLDGDDEDRLAREMHAFVNGL